MPPLLAEAHRALDCAVEKIYIGRSFKNDAERVAFLFALYERYTSILPATTTAKKRNSSAK